MCYSKLTFKGTSPVINETYKYFYLKVTGETKMRKNMDMNFEQTLTISQYYFLKAYGTVVVPIRLKRWMRPLTSKFLDFSHRIIVLCKYVMTIFSFHWFCVVAAAHSVVKHWLHLLQAPFLTLIFVVDRFKLYCTRSTLVFYLLSRLSTK